VVSHRWQEPLCTEAAKGITTVRSSYKPISMWRRSRLGRLSVCYSYLQSMQNSECAVNYL
jgi:hypothetical protein